MRTCLLAVALLFGGICSANAQAPQTPEEVSRASAEATNARGMAAMADFIHPDELQRFKNTLAPLFIENPSESTTWLLRKFFGKDATAETVRKMPPAVFMANVVKLAESQMPDAEPRVDDLQILGSVREGELIHLVTRSAVTLGSAQLTKMEVVSMKPYGDSWRMLLSGDVESMSRAIRAGLENAAQESTQ
ncbi:hypothetical protein [Stenotrophomonas sp. Iso1]|uniref:hypothetical protein n=1 Tax=Stenotrophomonas sp. Iso1 TaxID=2977283 RepID=UPI0022B7979D|nr:hypothetical protein [Stenotrophomonas sp. Iso1]